jgi:hypothetical protein
MRRVFAIALMTAFLAGCGSMPERDRAYVVGTTVGAGVGAVVGSATAGPPGGWIGAGIGGATGGAVAAIVRPDACYVRNRRGELWQVPCEGRQARLAEVCYVSGWFGSMEPVPCPTKVM